MSVSKNAMEKDTSGKDTDIDAAEAPFIEHLTELRTRLLISIGFFFPAFESKKNPTMSLTLIFGSMFSGKTEELIRRVRRYEAIGWTACVVNSSSDTRVAGRNVVRTHTGATHSAVVTSDLSEIGPDPKVVAVDEAQFFEDLEAHVCRWVEDEKRHVILSGLSGDFRRRSIGSMQDLIPFADEVVWKRALCADWRRRWAQTIRAPTASARWPRRATSSQPPTRWARRWNGTSWVV